MDASEWRGRVGDVWAREWERTDRTFADLSRHLDAAILEAAPETGAALDLGCGAGSTGLALARARPALSVTGIDLSAELVAVATSRGAALANVRFQVADASDPPPPILGGDHALAVSRHGVMFYADPTVAFTAIRGTLAAGAPLVFSCFQTVAANAWAGEVGAAIGVLDEPSDGYRPGPFAFADPDFVRGVLAEAGWRDAAVRGVSYRYVAGAGADPIGDATELFTRIGPAARALATLPEETRTAALARLRTVLERHLVDGAVDFPAAAWIWSARA